jgi:hypothetical protein
MHIATPLSRTVAKPKPRPEIAEQISQPLSIWCKQTLYTIYSSLNKTITSQGGQFPGSNLERTASIVNGERDNVTHFELQPTDNLRKEKNLDISDSFSRGKINRAAAVHRMKRSVMHLSYCYAPLVLSVVRVFCACQHLALISATDIISQKYILNIWTNCCISHKY